MTRGDRRALIADAVLELAAGGGNHAVTHQAVDRHLGLPKGSTSYYFRTRDALITAAVERLIGRSQEAFGSRLAAGPRAPLDLIVDYVTELVTERRTDVLARQALLLEPGLSAEIRHALAACFFSRDADVPDGLLIVLEGVVFTAVPAAETVDFAGLLGTLFPELRSLPPGQPEQRSEC
ncbi:MAG: TetR family transcriptional regulator [Gordonia sp. (in: high G+C Gram-positive bacteria)]